MAISQFVNPNLQRVYEAGRARLAEIERQKRAMATSAAARSGVRASGVSLIPQDEISRGAILAESQLGSDVAMQAEEERLANERFQQQRQLEQERGAWAEAVADRERAYYKRAGRAALGSQIVGGVLSSGLSALASRYLNPTRAREG